MKILDAALRYAQRDLHVFPIAAGGKTPLTSHGCYDGTRDTATITRWWSRWPSANVGLRCGEASNLVVLDFDCKKGKRGLESFDRLNQKFGIHTLLSRTPSGGVHAFYQFTPGLRNAVERLPGVDIRTNGGYVLLPPSTIDACSYQWAHLMKPAAMPAGVVELLRRPEPSSQIAREVRYSGGRQLLIERVRRYVAAVPPAIQGEGGDPRTYQLACRLVRGFALSDEEALAVLSTWNTRCVPPWSERELIAKIAGARKYGAEPIGGRLHA